MRRGFRAAPLLLFLLLATLPALAVTVTEFTIIDRDMQITLTNDQAEVVSGRTHLVGSIETIATFSLAPGTSQSVRAIAAGTALPAIVAIESTNVLRISTHRLALAHAGRPVRFTLRRRASSAIGQLVLAKLSGSGSINVYESNSSETPILSRAYDSKNLENQERISYASLLSGRPDFEGVVELKPTSGQAAFWVVNPPVGRRRSVDHPSSPAPRVATSGGQSCANATGFSVTASAANVTGYRWTALNANLTGTPFQPSTGFSLGSPGYATLLSAVSYADRGTGFAELNMKVEAPIVIRDLAANDADQGGDVAITWAKVQGVGLLRGSDFPAAGLTVDLSTGSYSYQAHDAGGKQVSLDPQGSCGSTGATAAYVVSTPGPVITNFSGSRTQVPFNENATLTFAYSGGTSWTISSSLGNCITPSGGDSTSGGTAIYNRCDIGGPDVLTLTVTGPGGSATRQITMDPDAPVISTFVSSSDTVGLGGTATLSFTYTRGTSWSLHSSRTNTITPSEGSSTSGGTATYKCDKVLGADDLTLIVTGPGGMSTRRIVIN